MEKSYNFFVLLHGKERTFRKDKTNPLLTFGGELLFKSEKKDAFQYKDSKKKVLKKFGSEMPAKDGKSFI